MSDSACGHRVVPVRCKTSGRLMLSGSTDQSTYFACREDRVGALPHACCVRRTERGDFYDLHRIFDRIGHQPEPIA
jgi:hypothetical protein